MCNSEDCPMTYRYIRRRKVHILLIITSLFALYILTDGFGTFSSYRYTDYDYDYKTDCKYPCIGRFCLYCGTPPPTTVKIIDIAEHLNLKQAIRSLERVDQDVQNSEQVCKRPSFDLKHDSVKYAFFKMTPLNCSAEELFYIENNIFKFNKTQLGVRELEKCRYYGIERASDDYASFTESLTKEKEPYSIKLMHDFIRIKCYLKHDDNDDKDLEIGNEDDGENKVLAFSMSNVSVHEIVDIEDNKHLSNDPVHYKNLHKRNVNGANESDKVQPENDRENIADEDKEYKTTKSHRQTDDKMNSDEMDMHDYWYNRFYDLEERADFDQFLVQIHPKREVFERISNKRASRLTGSQPRMNVLMFGLDSMSHMSFQRKLPKVYSYLKDVLGAVVMDGYNIVGDATTAALIPMLTGKTEVELPDVRKNRFDSEDVDVYPLVWKSFRDKGYVTMFAEDEPSISVFNLRLNGFRNQPTDHYMRPFWQALWDSDLRKDSPKYCTGNVPHHMYLINYLKDYFIKYSNVSKFAFVFGSELTHWDNNPGEYMEEDFMQLLTFLNNAGHLNNTLLIVFGDHGARYNRVRKTVQGKMEERLPMMSVTLPKWFREKYSQLYKNLKKNSDRLTTPFDIHETLLDVLDLRRTQSPINANQRGISLLHEIPINRTCDDAQIEMHWCTCLKQIDLDARDRHVQKSVTVLINVINQQTKKQRHFCSELKFQKLLYAFLLVPNEKVLMFQKSRDADNRVANFTRDIVVDHAHFQVTIETAPNNGLYEATIQANMTSGVYTVLGSEISRLDRYGNQPACVQDKYPDLRKYCFCKK